MQALRRPTVWVGVVLATLACLTVGWGAGHYRVYIVHTGSMEPTIPIRSAVVVERGPVRVGEVISFVSHNTVVTHRLVAVNPDGTYRTRGDANLTPDVSSVAASDVIGHVILAPRNAGAWLYFLKTPTGMASFLCLVLAAFVFIGPAERAAARHIRAPAPKPGAHRALPVPTGAHARPRGSPSAGPAAGRHAILQRSGARS